MKLNNFLYAIALLKAVPEKSCEAHQVVNNCEAQQRKELFGPNDNKNQLQMFN